MEKMGMKSKNIMSENVAKIGEMFPGCVTETADENGGLKKAIDFDKLKQELSNDVLEGDEAYEFDWVGKKAAMVEANKPTTNTLRPNKEDSVNWDNTENLYIEGDNLEVLKLLQESYLGKVKMIYIDPPYNTGNDFIYRDNFKQSREDYEEDSGELDEGGNRLFRNTDSNGRFHSDWCSMMYSRLKLAKNLLSEKGVIFVSIDDNEVENLKNICNEIFGENNFVSNTILQRSTNGMGDKKGFARNHEYIMTYQKSESTQFWGLTPNDEYCALFEKKDNFGRYKIDGILMKKGAGSRREDAPSLYFPLYYSPDTGHVSLEKIDGYKEKLPIKSNGSEGRWTWGREKVNNENHRLYASSSGTIYIKDYFTDDRRMKVKSILCDKNYITDRATNEIKELFNSKVFDTPKPVKLIKDLCDLMYDNKAIILDFFSGASTTAHAVMQLNADDGGNRKYIMVQLPEETNEKSDAYKAGYKNICEIGKERIRRAAKKIHEENPDAKFDDGFRDFKLDSSNMKDVYYSPNDIDKNIIELTESNIKEDRTDLDLLFQCLLDWGLPISKQHKAEKIDGFNVHFYNEDALVACFDENISEGCIKEIAKRKPLRVVFRDSSFKDSSSKINVEETFKMLSPKTTVKVI